MSNAQGRELAGGFARAGIGGDINQALVGSTQAFARATGSTDLSATGKTLADAFADPEKGAAELDHSLGFLNDRILTSIHAQEAAGDMERARQTLLDAYMASLRDVTDHTWTLSKAFDDVKVSTSNMFDRLGREVAGMFGAGDPAEKLGALRTQQSLLPANDTFNRARVQEQIDALTKQTGDQARQDQARAADAQRKAIADALSLQARDVIRGILPEIDRRETFQTQSGILQRAIGNPSGMADADDASRALGQLTVRNTFSDPLRVMATDAKVALDAVNAYSLAERAAVEARRAELDVLRETGDTAKASAAAQTSLNLAMAKAKSDAEDRFETSKQNLAMVGMTPFQRGLQEIKNRYEGYGGIFDKDSATRSELTTALRPVQDDLRSAGELVVDALRGVAAGIQGSRNPFGSLDGSAFGGSGRYADAIKAVESSGGNYGALGPVTKTGDRAYGAYQVMGANIPSWTKSALGFSETPSQFLADKSAQDAVFNHQFGTSLARYGNPSDAASVWFTGRPLAQGAGARDALGTTGSGYVDRFNAALAGPVADAAATRTFNQKSYRNDTSAYIGSNFDAPLKSANVDLDQQIKLLDVQQSTMGKSAAQIQAAAKAQELLNTYTAMDPNREAGPAMWSKISAGVDTYREKLTAVLERQAQLTEQNQKLISTMDGVRGAARDGLGTFVNDLRNGQSAGKALQDVMGGLETKILNLAEDQAIKGLFGASGTTGGGLFGSLFSSLLGTGGSTAAAAASGAGLDVSTAASALGMLFHSGGVVGFDQGPLKALPLTAWAGAPRHHTGYGLASDERPAILQTGEAVVSRADLAAARAQKSQAVAAAAAPAGAGAGLAPIIHNHLQPGQQMETKVERGPDGRHVIHQTVVSAVLTDLNSNGKIARAMKNFGGVGRTG